MKHLKTYEGLFDFLKRKPKEVKSEYFHISDDMFQTISDILQDVDLMGLEVHTTMTDGKRKIHSIINRTIEEGENRNWNGRIYSTRSPYSRLKDYNLDEMSNIITRVINYVRNESNNKLSVRVSFVGNGPHSENYYLTNPSDDIIYKQLEMFYGNSAHDWKSIQISIISENFKW